MKIQLSSELQAILKERSIYTNEFINEAIRFALENDDFKSRWLKKELQKGLVQADRGELYDLEDVMTEIRNLRSKCQTSSSPVKHAQI